MYVFFCLSMSYPILSICFFLSFSSAVFIGLKVILGKVTDHIRLKSIRFRSNTIISFHKNIPPKKNQIIHRIDNNEQEICSAALLTRLDSSGDAKLSRSTLTLTVNVSAMKYKDICLALQAMCKTYIIYRYICIIFDDCLENQNGKPPH